MKLAPVAPKIVVCAPPFVETAHVRQPKIAQTANLTADPARRYAETAVVKKAKPVRPALRTAARVLQEIVRDRAAHNHPKGVTATQNVSISMIVAPTPVKPAVSAHHKHKFAGNSDVSLRIRVRNPS